MRHHAACSIDSLLRLATTVAASLLLIGGVAVADDEARQLDQLAEWMTGTFSSAGQAAENPAFFAVTLHMAPVWTDRDDGPWLYVEQAMAEYPDQPYRQRVYRLHQVDQDLFESRVYTLPDPPAAVGAWRDEAPLEELGPSDLTEREGCSILMRRRGDAFIGSTLSTLCRSTLRGAVYATSEVLITAEGMVSWDRGFDADGTQVWGATEGGYVFDRIVDEPETEAGSQSETETEAGSESDSDSASDPDSSFESDADSESDSDGESESDAESEAESDSDPVPVPDAGR